MNRSLTCIICPRGCELSVTLENGRITYVSGNGCPRGAVYAEQECLAPTRTLTTTVRTADGGLVPVKTDKPIPKERLFEAMERINSVTAPLPIFIGDVLMNDLFGANLVATANKPQ